MFVKNLVPLIIALPLLTSSILIAFGNHLQRRLIESVSILINFVICLMCFKLLQVTYDGPIVYWFGGWMPSGYVALGIPFYVDIIAAGIAFMVSILTFGSLIFSWKYFKEIKGYYHALMLIFLASMCGFSLSGDLFNLFVWFELMSATAVSLCAYKSDELSALHGALNFAVTNTVGAFLSLTGLGLIYAKTGALNMAQIAISVSSTSINFLIVIAFLFICCGFLVKAAVVPFHFWLADAHAVAPTPVSVLFSGIMVELGLYAVARIYWVLFSNPFESQKVNIKMLFLAIGVMTSVLGAIMCYLQRHIKRLLAFSTISHIGVMVIAFALMNQKAFQGLVFYWIGHGFIKATLFILTGVILHHFESVDEYDLRSKGIKFKGISILFFIATFGLAGFPPFVNFMRKSYIEEISTGLHLHWISWIFIVCEGLTSGAILRVGLRIFTPLGAIAPILEEKTTFQSQAKSQPIRGKEENETMKSDSKIPQVMIFPAILFMVFAITPYFNPGVANQVEKASAEFLQPEIYIKKSLGEDVNTGNFRQHRMPQVSLNEKTKVGSSGVILLFFILFAGLFGLWMVPGIFSSKSIFTYPLRQIGSFLHSIHSGQIGDYLTWFTLGVALFGSYLSVF